MLDIEGLHFRAAFFRLIRSFFYRRDFLEVDTPIRQPVFIPESHIIPVKAENQYLQTSPELCMKRLLAAGCPKIFQICRCFRKEEHGRLHLEEFQMLEWYRANADYNTLMKDCEALLKFLFAGMLKSTNLGTGTHRQIFPDVDLYGRWPRITVAEAFRRYSPLGVSEALNAGKFDEILVLNIEPHLGRNSPEFLCDYPAELGSLARKMPGNPAVAERFELYVKGVELANGFSELTDSNEQRQRFLKEVAKIKEQTGHHADLPERFLDDLESLECAAGIALGLDRLFMIALGYDDIRRSVTFSPADFL